MDMSSTLLCEGTSDFHVDKIYGTTSGAQGEVIVTFRGRGVAVYSARSQKRLKFWPLASSQHHFAAEAVWDFVSEQYYAALESSTGSYELICWKGEADCSGDGLAGLQTRAVLLGPIFAMFPCSQVREVGNRGKTEDESGEGGAILVFRNGSVQTYNSALVQTASVSAPEGATWQAVEAASLPDASKPGSPSQSDLVLVTAVGTGKKKLKRFLQRFSLRLDERGSLGVVVAGSGEIQGGGGGGIGVEAVAAASVGREGDVALLWSDGWWETYRVSVGDNGVTCGTRRKLAKGFAAPPPPAPSAEKTPSKRRTPGKAKVESATEVQPGVAMTAIPGTAYVAIVGEGQGGGATDSVDINGLLQGGERAQSSMCVAVLDTLYGCVHVAQEVTVTGRTSGCGLKACGPGGLLLLSTGTQVHLVQVDLPPLSLAAVLGALRSQGPNTGWGALASHVAAAGAQVLDAAEVGRVREPPQTAVAEPQLGREGSGKAGKGGGEEGGGSGGGRLEEYFGARDWDAERLALSRVEGVPWEEEGLNQREAKEAELVQKLEGGGGEVGSEEEFLKLFAGYWRQVQKRSKGRRKGEEGVSHHRGAVENGLHASGGACMEEEGSSEEEEVGGRGEEGGQEHGAGNGVHSTRGEGDGQAGRVNAFDFLQVAPLLSPRLTAGAVARCLHSRLWGPLEGLIRGGQLAVTDCPDLMAKLIEADEVKLLDCCLGRIRDLPPSDLLSALRYLLGGEGRQRPKGFGEGLVKDRKRIALLAIKKAKLALGKKDVVIGEEGGELNGLIHGGRAGEGEEDVTVGVDSRDEKGNASTEKRRRDVIVREAVAAVASVEGFGPKELCLHSLVGVRRDEAVMSEAVRQLDTDQVVTFVGYLGKWMEKYTHKLAMDLAPAFKPSLPVPRLELLVGWWGVVLDCHLARLMLLGECQKGLLEVDGLVSRFVKISSDLKPLLGMLGHIRAKLPLPNQALNEGRGGGGYTVEVLNLS